MVGEEWLSPHITCTYLKLATDENTRLGLQLESLKMEDSMYGRKLSTEMQVFKREACNTTMECSFILKANQNLAREYKNETTWDTNC